MPSKTKSHILAENSTLRTRLAELEDRLAKSSSINGGGGNLSASDIAEGMRIQEVLKVSEIRYRRVFETAKDGILILDADTGRITDANPYLQKLLGYSLDELLGKTLWEIGPFRDVAASRAKRGSLIPLGPSRCEPARVLPCCFICSLLNSSERSGGSSPAYFFAGPVTRRLAPIWFKFSRMDLPLTFKQEDSFQRWIRSDRFWI